MATRIKLRRDIATNWTTVDPILANGEMGIEADTRRVKVGDGASKWSELKYAITDQLKIDGKTVSTELGMSIASQDPETWIATVRAQANWAGVNGIAYDKMGNLYLSGWEEYGYDHNNGDGNGRAFLTKFDTQGSVVWSKYTMLDGYSNGGGVVVDSEGNLITVTLDWDNDFFAITKMDTDGTVVWQKTYRDSYDYADGMALAVDSNNDIILAGRRGDENHDDNRALFALKVSGFNGTVMWTKVIGSWYTSIQQPCLTVDGSNNVIVGCWNNEWNNGNINLFKFDQDGGQVWYKTFENPEDVYDGYEFSLGSLDSDESGNIYFVGSYTVPNFVHDLHGNKWDGRASIVLKMDGTGAVQWSRLMGPGDCHDLGAQIVYKEGKLYALFQTERKYYSKDEWTQEDFNGYTTQEIVAACFDPDNGRVLWQNNLGPEMLWGYASPTSAPGTYQYTNNVSGRQIAVHGDYIAIAGQAGEYSRVDDTDIRSYGFLAQIPATGENLDIDGWKYRTTKYPGQYAQIKSNDWYQLEVNNTNNLYVSGSSEYLPEDTATGVKYGLISSGANQWDFKPNGDLALPVNGNLEFRRQADGDINIVGEFDSNNNNAIWNRFNSVTTDPEGNRYYVGVWNDHTNSDNNGNSRLPLVVKVNKAGEVEWKVRLSNNDLYNNYAVNGEATSVAYDPSSGNIVVVAYDSSEGNNEQMLVVDMNTDNGAVVDHKRYRDHNPHGYGYIYPYGMTINDAGERFITGELGGNNYHTFTVTNVMTVLGHTDTLDIPKTVFAGFDAPDFRYYGDWHIDVPGQGYYGVQNVDYYEGIEGTVRQGSGATFDVTADGAGGYSAVQGAGLGTFYQVGHQIKIPGTALGGVTPDNDATITVTAVDTPETGVITAIGSVYGTSTGSNTYTNLSGTNYNVGSGFSIGVQVDSNTGTLVVYHLNGGTNYVANDVVTFAGTSMGGTSPATDIVIKVLQVGMSVGDVQSGEDYGYQVTTRGVSPLTQVRVKFDYGPNLSTGGPWDLWHYTDNNSFLVKLSSTSTVDWAKFIDKEHNDRGVTVDYDSSGNLYWLSQVYDERHPGQSDYWRYRTAVVKLDDMGVKQWSKTYSWDGHEGFPQGLQVDSEDKIVIAQAKYNYSYHEYDPLIQRLESNGDLLWSKRTILDGGEGGPGGLALDDDDNIYYATERYNGENYCAWITKLDIKRGDALFQQDFANEDRNLWQSYQDGTNAIATDGKKYHLATQTWDLDGNEGNALGVSLPADGSASGQIAGGGSVTKVFAVDETFYNTEGGNGNGGWDDPISRDYTVAPWTTLELITNRDPIKSWMAYDPVSSYPVYVKSEAGIQFADGTVQTTSAAGLPQVRRSQWGKEYKLKLSDQGKHIYVTRNNNHIVIPPYSEVPFEVGAEITIVVRGTYDNTYVVFDQANGYRGRMMNPQWDGSEGSAPYYPCGFRFYSYSGGQIIKLIKTEESYSNGSVWFVEYKGGEANREN